MMRKSMMSKRKHVRTVSVLALAMLPVVAVATPVTEQSSLPGPSTAVPGILGFGASLLFVIAAILLVGWLYTRMQGIRGGTSNVIDILATQSLGAKERILLVGIGDKQIVIGMTATQLQTLHVFDEPVVSTAERPQSSAFAERLVAAIKSVSK